MSLLAIELNDAGMRGARPGDDGLLPVDGEHRSSPGFAWLRKSRDLVTGVAAAAQATLRPLAVDDRFWDRLDTEPVHPRQPRSPNRAEFACAHLGQVYAGLQRPGEDVVMAVPPDYDRRQLGILVGIARDLNLPLKGLVASPVALDPEPPLAGTFIVVELALHRCVLSVVEADDAVRLGPTRICPDVGWLPFRRQWIKAVGNEFVRTTRFDPLHDAATEQQLHERLPRILEALANHGSDSVELQSGSLSHRVTLAEQVLAHAGHELTFRVCAVMQELAAPRHLTAILLTHEAARVPGLRRALQQQIMTPVHELEAGAAARGLTRLWPQQFEPPASEGVALHTRRGGLAAPPPRPEAATPAPATHVLVGDQAHALQADPLFIDCDPGTGKLTIGGASGVACLRVKGQHVVLEVEEGRRVEVNGQEAGGDLPVGLGDEITVRGCSETMRIIASTG